MTDKLYRGRGGVGPNDWAVGAKLAVRAAHAFSAGQPGFYVRRKSRRHVVRGPFGSDAEAALARNVDYPDEPQNFEIVQVDS